PVPSGFTSSLPVAAAASFNSILARPCQSSNCTRGNLHGGKLLSTHIGSVVLIVSTPHSIPFCARRLVEVTFGTAEVRHFPLTFLTSATLCLISKRASASFSQVRTV